MCLLAGMYLHSVVFNVGGCVCVCACVRAYACVRLVDPREMTVYVVRDSPFFS